MLEHDVKSFAQCILRAVDTEVSRAVDQLISSDDLPGLGRITVDPGRYADSESYLRDVQCLALLKKFNDADAVLQKRLEDEAVLTFLKCETECARTNLRLADFVYNTCLFEGNKDERLWTYVRQVKRIVARWLGPLPTELRMRFGKGATMSDRGRLTTIMDKMSSTPTMTRDAEICIPFWTRTAWFRALASDSPHKSEPLVVEGNRFATVPKDCRKRRCIAVEPSLNIAYQLAVGKVLRSRLKRLGIDLDNGQVLHRRLARAASVDGKYATLDLSNASDTICRNLVRMILPPMWHDLLDYLRSPKTSVNGKWHVLEKFSSMGNGFTFELETLLFLALIHALDPANLQPGEHLFVYGDDIIVSTPYARSAVAVLKWAGFTLNMEKSFTSGDFRESCGGDYFKGRAVRPIHLEEAPSQPTDWIALANKLYRLAVDSYWGGNYELAQAVRTSEVLGWLMPAWAYCISQIPNAYRNCRGPSGRPDPKTGWAFSGDGWIYDSSEKWTHSTRGGIRYFKRLMTYQRRRPLTKYPGSVALAALVYGVPSDGMVPRGTPTMTHLTEAPFS
jgi:hypothetical protein